jgi:hypothetical protein
MVVEIFVNCYLDKITRVASLPVYPDLEKYYSNFTMANNLATLGIYQMQNETKITRVDLHTRFENQEPYTTFCPIKEYIIYKVIDTRIGREVP